MTTDDKAICLDILKRGLKSSFYYYQSGQEARSYINIDEAILGDDDTWKIRPQHEVVRQLGEQFKKKILKIEKERPFDRIAFIDKAGQGPVGTIALSNLLILLVQKEAIFVRPFRNTMRASIRGRSIQDKEKILIVSDVATTGQTILKAAEKTWNCGAIVAGALVYFDHERGAKENLISKDIPLFSLITRSEALERSKGDIDLTDQKFEVIHEFGGVI